MTKAKTKIGILGCGTVGSGLIQLLPKYPQIEIKRILVRNLDKNRDLGPDFTAKGSVFTANPEDIISNPEIDIVVELMGGVKGTKELLLKAIENGKSIVTANKDLLALEGKDLFEAARRKNCTIQYEAAVAGGIPVISTLKQSLSGNKIRKIYGIINGTTNYILDHMERGGADFGAVLKCAQELGFAESDPTNDIDGHDAAYKIAILASIVSGKRVDVNKVYREGIRKISTTDIKSAAKRGYKIKLLGIVENSEANLLDVRVHPTFVPLTNPLASVHEENNAILINGDAVQDLTLIGKGAGSLPTASSVLGDILMLASQLQSSDRPHPQHVCQHTEYAELKAMDEVTNSFYVRVAMMDKVGVLKDLGAITERNNANVKFIDQYDAKGDRALADFVVDPVPEKSMRRIIDEIKNLDSIKEVESVIRVLS
jgi:homoserine dehydrogenase